jgi:hypothetical protein
VSDVRAGQYRCTPLIKAGAMLPEARALLAQWDDTKPPKDNLRLALVDNWLGKASRTRAEAVLAIFRQRFLADAAILPSLLVLQRAGVSRRVIDILLYFYTTQADALLHDIVSEVIYQFQADGRESVEAAHVAALIDQWVRQGRAAGVWSAETVERATQGALTALRDFGLLVGPRKSPNKRIVRPYVPIEAFAYVAFWLHRRRPSGRQLIQDAEWRLFLLAPARVEQLLIEAHQERLLFFQMAGSTTRLDFPTDDPKEFASALAERATRAA